MKLDLGPRERQDLERAGSDAIRAFVEEAGIGDALIYNELVARLITLDGVLDVDLRMRPDADAESGGRRNVLPADPAQRPVLAEPGGLEVVIGATPVALDLTLEVTLLGVGTLGDADASRAAVRDEIESLLAERLQDSVPDADLGPAWLRGLIPPSDRYRVDDLHYRVDYVESGVRIRKQDVALPVGRLERLWLRSLRLASATSGGGG